MKRRVYIFDVINSILFITALLIVKSVAAAYIGYFSGIFVSILTLDLLGVSKQVIAQIFAWVYVGIAFFIFVIATITAGGR